MLKVILENAGLFSVADPFSVFQPAEGTVLAVGMSKTKGTVTYEVGLFTDNVSLFKAIEGNMLVNTAGVTGMNHTPTSGHVSGTWTASGTASSGYVYGVVDAAGFTDILAQNGGGWFQAPWWKLGPSIYVKKMVDLAPYDLRTVTTAHLHYGTADQITLTSADYLLLPENGTGGTYTEVLLRKSADVKAGDRFADFKDNGTGVKFDNVGITFEADSVVNRAYVQNLGGSNATASDTASIATYFIQTESITNI